MKSVRVAETGGLEEGNGRILFYSCCERGCFILHRNDGFRAVGAGDQEDGREMRVSRKIRNETISGIILQYLYIQLVLAS